MIAKLSKQNQRGQMAIFVALIFQILFLFFAMAINIGLVVHDKINLQNAVDLSAYYAAQRQAEMLNVIAHTNYQIRQSWKLLNWRYYVLGTMGMQSPPHPATLGGYPRAETMWQGLNNKAPVLCVTYNPVWEGNRIGRDENPCKTPDFDVPNIRIPTVVAPFLPFNLSFAGLARSIQRKIAESCEAYSGYNWFFGASIYTAYLLDQQSRKEMIRALARNMARKPGAMIDLKGDLIFDGAQKTFEKNLTATNNPDPSKPPRIEMYNSLEGLSPEQWLPEIDVWFTLQYQDMAGDASRCRAHTRRIYEVPTKGDRTWNSLVDLTGDSSGQKLDALAQYVTSAASVGAGDSRSLSIGVEKNPWYMAYVGVKAKTKPRALFFPFGEPVEFEARAFAQPFGGRVGPWYGRLWARGANSSSGDRVQLSPEKRLANGMLNSNNEMNLIPQYSKYPGDKLGLRSVLAQNSLTAQSGIKASIYDYVDLTSGFGTQSANDILAFDSPPSSNVRRYEIAAVAPDLFDITYYSIQPNFGKMYLRDLRGNADKFGLSDRDYPRGDIGSRDPDGSFFSVQDQIALTKGQGNVPNLQALDAFWYVREREHLLTSWVHNDTYGEYFAFPQQRFGKCQQFDDKLKITAPGSCVHEGGRSGYSVKIVSPEVFRAPLALGGGDDAQGVILNPPPENW